MDNRVALDKEFSTQSFVEEQPYEEMLDKYKEMACNYSQMENVIAVLSDLRTNTSYIHYGSFSQMLGIDEYRKENKVCSIWEEEIFKLIHPDDLASKHLHELCFFHFIKRQPKKKRKDYYLTSKLRMKSDTNSYINVLHRIFYISAPFNDTLWLAMCLYSPLVFDIPSKYLIVNSSNGQITELDQQNNAKILSAREKQVLHLINQGYPSKEITEMLSISINTVSRHRQEILGKLQVKNSIEACRIGKDLKLI